MSKATLPPRPGASRPSPPLHMKKNKYASGAEQPKTKLEMELELKQQGTFNTEVYEARVRQSYLETQVIRALYTQTQTVRRQQIIAAHKQRMADNLRREQVVNTPYLRRKESDRSAKEFQQQQRARSAPMFRDVAAIEAHIREANLASRGVTLASALAQPATPRELALRVTIPPPESLMNPRNVSSPLPDWAELPANVQPPSPTKKTAARAGSAGGRASVSSAVTAALSKDRRPASAFGTFSMRHGGGHSPRGAQPRPSWKADLVSSMCVPTPAALVAPRVEQRPFSAAIPSGSVAKRAVAGVKEGRPPSAPEAVRAPAGLGHEIAAAPERKAARPPDPKALSRKW